LIFWKTENQRNFFSHILKFLGIEEPTFSNFKHEGSLLMMQPCKTLFIKTPKIWKMYKKIRKRKARICKMLS